MEELKIYHYQADTIANALRIAMNILNSRVKQTETAADRELLRADRYIKNVLNKTIENPINYPLTPEDMIDPWDIIAKRLGLRELDKPLNIWVNEDGFEFKLTKYGFEVVRTAK